MFPSQRVEMAYFDHDYITKYSNHDTRLHSNVTHYTEDYFNRRFDPVPNRFPVRMSNSEDVRPEQIFRHQHQDISTYGNCERLQISTYHGSEINQVVENNQQFYDISESYSAKSCQAQRLVRGTLEPYLRFHSTERRHHENFAHHRPSKIITKRKSRTVFNTQQILILEKIFKKKPYINREERQILVEMLNVSDRVIKVWFQNRRRSSGANQRELEPIEPYSDTSNEEIDATFNLSYVESKIKDADEFGYVTLDDRAMHELITVVDAFLTDIDLNKPVKSNTEISDPVKYEPISPVSINDYDDDVVSYMPQWEPNEPEVSLRHLFDVQALMSI